MGVHKAKLSESLKSCHSLCFGLVVHSPYKACTLYGPMYGPPVAESDPTGRGAHEPGSKLDAGKSRPALVLGGFARALSAVVEVGTYGSRKYTPNGWRTVPDGVERYTEAMMRHWLAEAQGLECDSDSHLLHAAHTAWNALARLERMLLEVEQKANMKS